MGLKAEKRYFLISYMLNAAALLAVLLPFLRHNNLLEWDFPGHYAAVWFLKNQLFPWPGGWNPYFYCGYPQGIFYPPLSHYLAALLSYPLGIALGMKALLAVSILLLPATFYAFARRWGLTVLQAGVCSCWMTAVLFLSGELLGTWSLGSDLRSIVNFGLFANSLSLPVLFAFLACCGAGSPQKSWKAAAALFGVLLLLHPLSSIVAGLFLLALFFARFLWPTIESSEWKVLFYTLSVGLLIGAPWVLPYATHRAYMNTAFVPPHWSYAVQFLVLNGLALAIACFSNHRLRPLSLLYLALANFILIGTMWQMDIQFTRLTIYLILFTPCFLLIWIQSRVTLLAMTALALGVGIYGYLYSGIKPVGVPDFPVPDFGRVQGRILSVASQNHLPSFHVNQDPIAVRTGNASLMGLFIESSLNGRFIANLMKSLEPDSYVWGTPTEFVPQEVLGKDYPRYVQDRLRLFGVQHVYTDLKLEKIVDPSLASAKRYVHSYPAPALSSPKEVAALSERYNTHDGMLDFYLYPLGSGALAEALPYVPKAPGSDWKLTNQKWFLEMRGVPIFTDRPPPADARAARPDETVEILEVSPRMDRIVLQINSDQDIPVLVKVGYFPTWRLSLRGSSSQVYRASPSLILVFAHGRVVLQYSRPWEEYLGYLLFLIGIALLIFRTPLVPRGTFLPRSFAYPSRS